MVDIITFKNKNYPLFQSKGFAAQFAIPFAKHVCVGKGVDIGCNRIEWCFPGAIPIDPIINEYDALNIPFDDLDYIFSSHCLEHIPDWISVMDYWFTKLKTGGTLFLYLPDYSQEYWKPWNNRKHKNIFYPEIIEDYMIDKKYKNIFISGVDLNNSFMCIGEK